MTQNPDEVHVEVDGRRLVLTNLAKVLYPATGTTKAEVISYYQQIAPVLLPHIADRPVTLKRYPDGVDGTFFYAKHVPNGAPDWLRTERIAAPGSRRDRAFVEYVIGGDLATLIWWANLAGLELHVPQWRVGHADAVDLLVFDLDPGPPATIVDCATVALWLRELLDEQHLAAYPKTSGSKGLHLYVAVQNTSPEQSSALARSLATRLAQQHPSLVTATMNKEARSGKVFLDWSQNNAAKTTVAAYSLRATPEPCASTPITWEEVAACRRPGDLRFVATDTVARVAAHGDLLAPLLKPRESE